jgi:hypothetical protein
MLRIDFASISSSERLTEIAEILALGLMRLQALKSSALSPHAGEGSLDCAASQSGHADALSTHGGSVD